MNTFMIHANIEFLNFWNFLISETYSFSEHFRSNIKIYRFYHIQGSPDHQVRGATGPNWPEGFFVLVRVGPGPNRP